MRGLHKQAEDAGLKGKPSDPRVLRSRCDDIVGWKDAESLAGDGQAAKDGDVERIQLHPAVEACPQGLDNSIFEDWAHAAEGELGCNQQQEKKRAGGNGDPPQRPDAGAAP